MTRARDKLSFRDKRLYRAFRIKLNTQKVFNWKKVKKEKAVVLMSQIKNPHYELLVIS